MWPEYLHHVLLHFPIVMSMALAALGVWTRHDEAPVVRSFLRGAGWITLALTSVAAISGILAAPGWLGGDGTTALRDHRDLGVTAWAVIALAAGAYEIGARQDERDWRMFAVAMWCVASVAVIGAGHWGGSTEHADVVPFALP